MSWNRDAERLAILERIVPLFDHCGESSFGDAAFNDLALAVYRFQFERCGPYRRFCEGEGCSASLDDWRRIPCVPTDTFKFYRLACFPPTPGEIVFHTSGTTQQRPGVHVLPNAELYDSAAMPWFAKHLLHDFTSSGIDRKLRFASLTASPSEMPHSSLVHMIATAGKRFGKNGKVEYFVANRELDFERLARVFEESISENEPLLMFATSFSLVRLLEELDLRKAHITLAKGSRMMETGGYKGKSRRLNPGELYEWTSQSLGLPLSHIVNEYGMTEMSSQIYDRTLSEPNLLADQARIKIPPPWVRSTVVNPATLEPVAEGEIGVLRHMDLANLDSCAFLLTADAARKRGDGFELLGRLEEAEARGCSLVYETNT